MNIQFEKCKTIREFADNAADFQRSGLYKEKKGTNSLVIPKEYTTFYENHDIFLLEDITLQVEYTKQQWEKNRKTGNEEVFSVRKLGKAKVDDSLNHIATVSHYILEFARNLSIQTKRATVVIYNARAALIYSYLLEDDVEIVFQDEKKERVNINDVNAEKIQKLYNEVNIQSCIIPIRDMKISSHQYVQTVEEVEILQKQTIKNVLRRSYDDMNCQINEYIPEVFLEYLKNKFTVLFVDIPTWGKNYASSTGLVRKQSDIEKRRKGIYTPYKFVSYAEYANYQVASFSISKEMFKNEVEDFMIQQEDIDRIDPSYPLAFILNPEIERDIWWDNSPQLVEKKWKKYCERGFGEECIMVKSNCGNFNIVEYIKKKIQGAKKIDGVFF